MKFNFEADEIVVGDLLLEGEQGSDERLSLNAPETTDHDHQSATTGTELCQISVENIQNRQENLTNHPEPVEGRGKRVRKETEYVRMLREGSAVTGGKNLLPKGLQHGTTTQNEPANTDVVEQAMATVVESVEGLTLTYAEARRRPDWPKWEDAIKKELQGLNEIGTW